MFCQAVLLVSGWRKFNTFAECADAAKLLALFWLAHVQWAIGCGQSGSVDSLIGFGRGAGALGSEAGTLGSDAHSLTVDDGSIGATPGGGGRIPGCVEIRAEGG